eukprot:1995046-Amphidinium_carterae.1
MFVEQPLVLRACHTLVVHSSTQHGAGLSLQLVPLQRLRKWQPGQLARFEPAIESFNPKQQRTRESS